MAGNNGLEDSKRREDLTVYNDYTHIISIKRLVQEATRPDVPRGEVLSRLHSLLSPCFDMIGLQYPLDSIWVHHLIHVAEATIDLMVIDQSWASVVELVWDQDWLLRCMAVCNNFSNALAWPIIPKNSKKNRRYIGGKAEQAAWSERRAVGSTGDPQ